MGWLDSAADVEVTREMFANCVQNHRQSLERAGGVFVEVRGLEKSQCGKGAAKVILSKVVELIKAQRRPSSSTSARILHHFATRTFRWRGFRWHHSYSMR